MKETFREGDKVKALTLDFGEIDVHFDKNKVYTVGYVDYNPFRNHCKFRIINNGKEVKGRSAKDGTLKPISFDQSNFVKVKD